MFFQSFLALVSFTTASPYSGNIPLFFGFPKRKTFVDDLSDY
jgi:hypothetical protein